MTTPDVSASDLVLIALLCAHLGHHRLAAFRVMNRPGWSPGVSRLREGCCAALVVMRIPETSSASVDGVPAGTGTPPRCQLSRDERARFANMRDVECVAGPGRCDE